MKTLNPIIKEIAQIIYAAKKEDAWGNLQSQYRKEWPKTDKDLRTCLHNGSDPGVEFAIVQAEAVYNYVTMAKADLIELLTDNLNRHRARANKMFDVQAQGQQMGYEEAIPLVEAFLNTAGDIA